MRTPASAGVKAAAEATKAEKITLADEFKATKAEKITLADELEATKAEKTTLADELEVPLIFDEIAAAFRIAPGGAQELYGVEPDLCLLGKVPSGGLPIAIFRRCSFHRILFWHQWL